MRIRAHHLLCLSTFRGEGYSPAFVRNMGRVWRWAKAGGRAKLVASPDAICRVCPEEECRAEARDLRLLELTGWTEGEIIPVKERIRSLIPDRRRLVAVVCVDCPWLELCERTTASF